VIDLFTLEFFAFLGEDYPTVKVSIDFVDFLMAKIFCSVIEEWFQTLECVQSSKLISKLIRHVSAIRVAVSQFGRLGSAAFLAGYVWFSGGAINDFGKLAYAAAIALCMWALIAVSTTFLNKITADRILSNVTPSALILTEADKKAYNALKEKKASASKTLASIAGVGVFNIVLNIIASFIFVWLTLPSTHH
jgi:hypothetical protein